MVIGKKRRYNKTICSKLHGEIHYKISIAGKNKVRIWVCTNEFEAVSFYRTKNKIYPILKEEDLLGIKEKLDELVVILTR